MTAQEPDIFMYQGNPFSVAGVNANLPFAPADFGLRPRGTSSACQRGFILTFALTENRLTLQDLAVTLVNPDFSRQEGPAVKGIAPQEGQNLFCNTLYAGLNLPLDYTGGMLIATDFIEELYEHRGFQAPWKYKTVRELVFERGTLTKERDFSQEMAADRAKILGSGRGPR